MYRCNYCSNFAMFECSEDKFCRHHRENHDSIHNERHYFRDIYCRQSIQQKEEFQDEVSSRLKILKQYKIQVSQVAAKYIQDIQANLADLLSKIDEISKLYIDLMQKIDFTEDELEQVERISLSKLSLKSLSPFDDNRFRDYINQEILVQKGLELSNLSEEEMKEWFEKLGLAKFYFKSTCEIKITRNLNYVFVCKS